MRVRLRALLEHGGNMVSSKVESSSYEFIHLICLHWSLPIVPGSVLSIEDMRCAFLFVFLF